MYLPIDAERAAYLVWKVRTNGDRRWLTKEDCPTRIHEDVTVAIEEAQKLTRKFGEEFIVVQTLASITPPPKPDVVVTFLSPV